MISIWLWGHRGRYYQKAIPVDELDLNLVHTTTDEENGDDVVDVDDDDDDDEDVEEWRRRWRECDAYTPRIKKK